MRSTARLGSHPIHPMLVAFPLGLWITSFIFDSLGRLMSQPALWAAGFYCAVVGIVGALLAAVPGVIDLFFTIPPRSSGRKRGYLHGGLNVTVLVLFAIIAFRRGGGAVMPDNTSIGISILGVLILGYSGWLGGTLAYRNQIGVDRRYANAGQLRERT